MMANALMVLAMMLLLAAALARRPNAITLTLALAFGLMLATVEFLPQRDWLPAGLALDTLVVAVMAVYARQGNETARIIMVIGLLKVVFAVFAVVVDLGQWPRAATRNAAFIVQIVVAGGMADGIIIWLGHRAGELGDLRRRMLDRLRGAG